MKSAVTAVIAMVLASCASAPNRAEYRDDFLNRSSGTGIPSAADRHVDREEHREERRERAAEFSTRRGTW
jgi:hypothetical protein